MKSMLKKKEDGATLASKSSYWAYMRYHTYCNVGAMHSLSNYMGCARLSIRVVTHHVACIFVSILTYTRSNVKKVKYQLVIGQFHKTSGKPWRKTKQLRKRAR